jgi:hypothetical protein
MLAIRRLESAEFRTASLLHAVRLSLETEQPESE